jgi:single-strand DNA-binding protein
MLNINTVTLVGRAGRDPDLTHFESGSVLAKVSLAVDRRNRSKEPDWFNLEIWGKNAEVVSQYVHSGKLLSVTGRLAFNHWEDTVTGKQRCTPIIKVDAVTLLSSGTSRQDEAAS